MFLPASMKETIKHDRYAKISSIKVPYKLICYPRYTNRIYLFRPKSNTFAYDLSAHLADIVAPLTRKSDYIVKNSAHFVSTIKKE